MEQSLAITITAQRTIDDFYNAWQREDNLCHIAPMAIIGSQNFHWWVLTTRSLSLRVEAIREQPARRSDGLWDRPRAFRMVRVQEGKRDEQERSPQMLFALRQGGIDPRSGWLLDHLASSDFISLQYAVGRCIVTISPEGEAACASA